MLRRFALASLIMSAQPILAAAQAGSPAGSVPTPVLMARREALLKRLGQIGGNVVAVIRSADEKSIEGDYPQDSDFRQDNNFFYLTGLETEQSWLVLVSKSGQPGKVILYIPPRDSLEERWTGPRLAPGPEVTALSGIEDVRSTQTIGQEARKLLLNGSGVSLLYPAFDGGAKEMEFLHELGLSDSAGRTLERRSLQPLLGALRVVKDSDEILRLRRAIDITVEAEREAMKAASPGMWEYELEALIEYTFRRRGAERLGFPSIVGSGINSTTLHYDKNRRRTEPGDLVVMDIGAEYGYYSADVTRTIPISGRFTPRQRAIYDLVLATQQAGIDAIRPGMTIGRLNSVARDYMREHSGDLCKPGTCDQYFIHGLSHWLGMDVHDIGDYSAKLVPGMVLTVEPGIYIPAERLGVRIEDDVLVTANGSEVLSAGAPRKAEEIEQLMKK